MKIFRYTADFQKEAGLKFKAEPWMHIAVTDSNEYAIYVWDSRQVLETGKLSKLPAQASIANDNKKPIVGKDAEKFELEFSLLNKTSAADSANIFKAATAQLVQAQKAKSTADKASLMSNADKLVTDIVSRKLAGVTDADKQWDILTSLMSSTNMPRISMLLNKYRDSLRHSIRLKHS